MAVKGCKKCCLSSVTDRMDDMLWNGNKEDGNVRSVKKMEVLTMKIGTATLISRGR
jgi:hypothetical protein